MVAAGTIVVDVKKPARIILRNTIIIFFFSRFSIKCRERRKKSEQKKKENFDLDFYDQQKTTNDYEPSTDKEEV